MGLKVKAKSEMVAQLCCLITNNSWVNYEIGQMSLFPETLWTREACSCCIAVPEPAAQTYTGPVLLAVVGSEGSALLSSVNLLASLHMSKAAGWCCAGEGGGNVCNYRKESC